MESFKIEGGYPLHGEITPQGAKNEALQILCLVLLTDEKVTIHNLPDILDVNKLIQLLENLGVKIQKLAKGSYTFQADEINMDYLSSKEFAKQSQSLRGSIMILGPLLARFGYGGIPKPGGDKIGRRRLDTHVDGFVPTPNTNIITLSLPLMGLREIISFLMRLPLQVQPISSWLLP